MNATTSPVARIAGVAIVLILAAVVGLMAGNALNARDAGPAGGPGPFPNVWGNHAAVDAATGAPAYADPYLQIIQQAAANDAGPVTSESWGNIANADAADAAPVTSESWGNIADADAADDTFTQTWGNLDERRRAPSSDETSARESLTAPTPD